VVIDANSITSASQTITADMRYLGKDISFAGVLNSPALTYSTNQSHGILGSLTYGSGMTITLNTSTTGSPQLEGTGSHTITTNAVTLGKCHQFVPFGGTYTLQDDMTFGAGVQVQIGKNGSTIPTGTFDANGNDISAALFDLDWSQPRVIRMGEGTWTVSGGNGDVWYTETTASLTLYPETSTIVIDNADANPKVFYGGGREFHDFTISGAGTGTTTIQESAQFHEFKVLNAPKTVTFIAGITVTILSKWNVTGSAGNLITIATDVGGSPFTLTSPCIINQVSDYLSLKDCAATGSSAWFAGANTTNVSGNTGWTFAAPTAMYRTKAPAGVAVGAPLSF
jgi:hypothetical protein